MTEVKRTPGGWVLEITDTEHGMLSQGGVCGRREWYSRARLAWAGIPYDADPEGNDACAGVNNIQYLRHIKCDRVLRRGHIIQ